MYDNNHSPETNESTDKPKAPPLLDRQAKLVADFFIEGLTSADGNGWKKPWSNVNLPPSMPYNPTTGKPYKGGNCWSLMAAQQDLAEKGVASALDDPRFMTYKQAQAVGAQVRPGEKGYLCVAWHEQKGRGKAETENEGEDKAVRPNRRFAMAFTVFHASQIDGLPERVVPEVKPMSERLAAVETLVNDSGAKLKPGPAAYYTPATDQITIPPMATFEDEVSYAGTLLHEMGHWTGHESRLNRPFSFDRSSADYAKEELRAEISAYMASIRLGIPLNPEHEEQHQQYVSNWSALLAKDPKEIMRAVNDAEKICTFLKVPEREYEVLPKVEKSQTQTAEATAENEAPQPEQRRAGGRGSR